MISRANLTKWYFLFQHSRCVPYILSHPSLPCSVLHIILSGWYFFLYSLHSFHPTLSDLLAFWKIYLSQNYCTSNLSSRSCLCYSLFLTLVPNTLSTTCETIKVMIIKNLSLLQTLETLSSVNIVNNSGRSVNMPAGLETFSFPNINTLVWQSSLIGELVQETLVTS